MGSTGDRAASLMLGEREACTWGRTASSAPFGPSWSTIPKTIEASEGAATGADRMVVLCARVGINSPTDAYKSVQWWKLSKVPSFGTN
jgi:hypothetical protein